MINVITHTPTSGVTVNADEDASSSTILPSAESYEYKRMLSMLGFNVDLPEEPEKSDSEKFNIADYVVSML